MTSDALDLVQMGQRLVTVRGANSQAGWADVLEVHRNTYARWEKGEVGMSVEAMHKLVARGWSATWLLTGEGPEHLEPDMAAFDDVMVGGAGIEISAPSGDAMSGEVTLTPRLRESSEAYAHPSQLLRQDVISMAVQLAQEALEGRTLDPPDYGQLVSLIHGALVNGLPSAQVLAFSRLAARGLKGGSDGSDVGATGQAAAG